MNTQCSLPSHQQPSRKGFSHRAFPCLLLLAFQLLPVGLSYGQTVYGGPRELVESFYPNLPLGLGWKGSGWSFLPQDPHGEVIFVHVPNDGIDPSKTKTLFDLEIPYVDQFVSSGNRLVKRAERGQGQKLLFIAGPDIRTITEGFVEDKQLRDSLLWITDGFARLSVIPPKDQSAAYSATTAHFSYSRNGHRGWTDEDALGLLETAYAWYSEFFGFSPVDTVEVDDHLADFPPADSKPGEILKNPPYKKTTGARAAKLVFGLRENYGLTPREHDMGYHFLSHELLHCWLDPNRSSEYEYAEPLTQFLAQRFLLENDYITKGSYELDMEDRRKRTAEGKSTDIDRLVLKLDALWIADEDACKALLRRASPALMKGDGSAARIIRKALGK